MTAIEFFKAALTNFGYSHSCRATLLCDGRSILASGQDKQLIECGVHPFMTLTLIRGSGPGGSKKTKSSISVEKPSKQFPSKNSFAGPKNHALSTNFSKGSPRSLKLFVHLLETGKTLVSLAPFEMTLGSFIQAVLIEAGLAP